MPSSASAPLRPLVPSFAVLGIGCLVEVVQVSFSHALAGVSLAVQMVLTPEPAVCMSLFASCPRTDCLNQLGRMLTTDVPLTEIMPVYGPNSNNSEEVSVGC